MPLRVQEETVVVPNHAIDQQRRDAALFDELDLRGVQSTKVIDSHGRRRRRIATRARGDNGKQYQ